GTGKYNVFFNSIQVITDAYASAKSNITHTSTNYATRTYSSSAISDAFGSGTKHVISLSGNGLIPMQQIFYVYTGRNYFYTEVVLNGSGANSYYMAPLISTNVYLPASGDNRVLWSPFDNDTFIKYDALSMGTVNTTSSEVSAIYDNTSRNGLVLGSVEHSDWKTGIQVTGSGRNLSQLSAFGGFTQESNTRDKKGHGWVGVGTSTAKSPKVMVGYFTDWRTGLEEFGKSNPIAEPPYVFNWTQPTPFGWNSWGSIQSNLNLTNAKGVVDFFSNSLTGFRNGNTAYIDLDSYWDNLNDAELKQFADYCKSKGLKPGIYWAPFVDWGKTSRTVEGSSYNYTDIWTKVNGLYHDLDGCRALDPTHPGTKQRIAYLIGRFKTAGFQMIKIDFLGHAAMEADSYYDGSVQTGMQAYRKGMEYLIDQLSGQMLVYAAISPNLASGRYVHTRRIACDAFSSIADTKYTLNSTNYGWWQTYVYKYIDADHMVLGNETIGTNRARVTSGVINGTLITGDNYSTTGQWTGRAQTLLQNQEVLDIARNGVAFRPVEGNTGNGTSELFVRQIGSYFYVAALNYGTTSKSFTSAFSRLGLPDGTYSVKELYSGTVSSATNSLNFTLGASDASIYRISLGSASPLMSTKTTDRDLILAPVDDNLIGDKIQALPYPNPVSSILKFNNDIIISKVKISSVSTGQTIKDISKINNKYFELNMSAFTSGLYILTITDTSGGVKSYKIIKE
ncbi:MAG: Carbohydrate binding family 6, partial [Daejeonella sp.]|nr:Carbohydrate binding family 6 [Daejeonella sp.]